MRDDRCTYTAPDGDRCRRRPFRLLNSQAACSWHWQRMLAQLLGAEPAAVVHVARAKWPDHSREEEEA